MTLRGIIPRQARSAKWKKRDVARPGGRVRRVRVDGRRELERGGGWTGRISASGTRGYRRVHGGGWGLSCWRGGIGVSAFFACASRCALRPCTRWAASRTVGVGVLSAPAGFRTLESTIGLPEWFQERPGPAKTRGTAYTWAADTPPCLVFFLFFCLATLFHFLFLSPPFSPTRSPVPVITALLILAPKPRLLLLCDSSLILLFFTVLPPFFAAKARGRAGSTMMRLRAQMSRRRFSIPCLNARAFTICYRGDLASVSSCVIVRRARSQVT